MSLNKDAYKTFCKEVAELAMASTIDHPLGLVFPTPIQHVPRLSDNKKFMDLMKTIKQQLN